MSLLEKALERTVRKPRGSCSDDELDLALAALVGDVSDQAALEVLGCSQPVVAKLWTFLKAAVRDGRVGFERTRKP